MRLKTRIIHPITMYSRLIKTGLLVLLLSAFHAPAANLAWTNQAGGNWSLNKNWSPNQVPAVSDNVFITNNGSYTALVDGNFTVATLTFGGQSGRQTVSLDNSANSLTLNGASLSKTTNGVLSLGAGTLAGSGSLTLAGPLAWTGGMITNGGALICSGGVTMNGPSDRCLLGRVLVNAGQMTWSEGALVTGSGSVISNQAGATFDITGNVSTSFQDDIPLGTIANAGVLHKTSAGTASLEDVVLNSGTLEVQAGTLDCLKACTNLAGVIRLMGGSALAARQQLRLAGGTLTGAGTVSGTLINNSVVSPGLGVGNLIIQGDYVENANATLQIEWGGASSFDQLTVMGAASPMGKLTVILTNGFYPAPAASIQFLSSFPLLGNFSSFTYPTNDVGMQVSSTMTAASVTVINTRPTTTAIANATNDEMVAYSQQIAASDKDTPAQTLEYALLSPPSGMTISSSGLIGWTPTEAQGPGTYTVTATITDRHPSISTCQRLTATNRYQLTVREINRPPVMNPIANATNHARAGFTTAVSVSDPDLPANTFTYNLLNKPTGMTISSGGVIQWTNTDVQARTTNTVRVKVADNGAPSLSATQTFSVVVLPRPLLSALAFLQQQVTNVATNPPQVYWQVQPQLSWSAIPGTRYRLTRNAALAGTNWTSYPTGAPTYVTATTTNVVLLGPPVGTPSGFSTDNFYRIEVVP